MQRRSRGWAPTYPASSNVLPGRAPSAMPRIAPPRWWPIRSAPGSPRIWWRAPERREPGLMVALKASEVAGFLARPDPARLIALVFGPDAGLVNERAPALVRAAVDDLDDPFSLVRLSGDDLAA